MSPAVNMAELSRRAIVAGFVRRACLALRLLPRRAGWFYMRACLRALRIHDRWSFWSTLPPEELAALVEVGRGRRSVVELGTGTGWTTLVLALAEPDRVVRTWDTEVKPQRAEYFALVNQDTRDRVLVAHGRGEEAELPPQGVDLLYVDSNHAREIVVRSFEHWRDRLADDGVVVFDDYGNENYPGVREAVSELELEGWTVGRLFVWPVSER